MQIKQILIAIDQLANALLGGWSDETISSRCWRMRNVSRFWQKMLSGIDWLFGSGHCEASYLADLICCGSPNRNEAIALIKKGPKR